MKEMSRENMRIKRQKNIFNLQPQHQNQLNKGENRARVSSGIGPCANGLMYVEAMGHTFVHRNDDHIICHIFCVKI